MSDEQKRILALTSALGLALGALEVIKLSPHDFSQEGVAYVIKHLKLALGTEPIIIPASVEVKK